MTPTVLLKSVLCASKLLIFVILLTGCNSRAFEIDPAIARPCALSSPSPFPPLNEEERNTSWGQEFLIAESFLADNDLYRAISCYKRALILQPPETARLYIEYGLIYTYFLGEKYDEVIKEFEKSTLAGVPATFPTFRNLLVMLYESYRATCNVYRAKIMQALIKEYDAGLLEKLELSHALLEGDVCKIKEHLACHPTVAGWYSCYEKNALSPKKHKF